MSPPWVSIEDFSYLLLIFGLLLSKAPCQIPSKCMGISRGGGLDIDRCITPTQAKSSLRNEAGQACTQQQPYLPKAKVVHVAGRSTL